MLHAHFNNFKKDLLTFQETDTVTRRCSIKPLFLNILQDFREDICAGVRF